MFNNNLFLVICIDNHVSNINIYVCLQICINNYRYIHVQCTCLWFIEIV